MKLDIGRLGLFAKAIGLESDDVEVEVDADSDNPAFSFWVKLIFTRGALANLWEKEIEVI